MASGLKPPIPKHPAWMAYVIVFPLLAVAFITSPIWLAVYVGLMAVRTIKSSFSTAPNSKRPQWPQSREGTMLEVIARKCYSMWVDLKYGGILKGSLPSRHPEGFETANSGYDVLEHLLSERVRPDDVFVDVGCGKGRPLNWWIEHYPQAKGYGLEIDEDVGQKVKRRLRRHPQISILIGDAPQLIPEDGSLFYLFNPFGENVMQRFADRIALNPVSSNRTPRRIVYYFSRFLAPFDRPEFKISQLKLRDHDCAIIDAAL